MSIDRRSLYKTRFEAIGVAKRAAIWAILCRDFFQKIIPARARVLDLGAGYCEFINHIQAELRVAFDINPETGLQAAPTVSPTLGSVSRLPFANGSFDVVMASNLLEHLPSKDDVLATLVEVKRVLANGGLFIVMQPNIRFAFRQYWDHFDHHLPLSDRSMVEALELVGFAIERQIPKFLPYSMASRLPTSAILIRVYLRVPALWRLFGKQMLLVARRQDP